MPNRTFCLVRWATDGHDRWALHNLWALWPNSHTILLGDPTNIFDSMDATYHTIESTPTFRGTIDLFRKNPTPYLVFVRSTCIITSESGEGWPKGNETTCWGKWDDGLLGLLNFSLLTNFSTFDFFKGAIDDGDVLEYICRKNRVVCENSIPYMHKTPKLTPEPIPYTRVTEKSYVEASQPKPEDIQ